MSIPKSLPGMGIIRGSGGPNVTRWEGDYVEGTSYKAYDMALDEGWLGVANKDTSEPLAPQPVGPQFYVYDGTVTTAQDTSKLIHTGNRYTFAESAIISAYRVYLIGGNTYEVTSIKDPLGTPIINQLSALEPPTTGWFVLQIEPVLAHAGEAVDLILSSREPDVTPTIFSGNWNYIASTNEVVPLAGQITHANKALSIIRVHKTDNDAGDRSAALAGLTIGDVFSGAGLSWAIQAITDVTTYYEYAVAPAQQGAPNGIQNFDFETVTATPITYMEDVSYWSTNASVQGVLALDGDYSNATINENAYGTDILLQDFIFSPDWDLLAYTNILKGIDGDYGGIVRVGSTVLPRTVSTTTDTLRVEDQYILVDDTTAGGAVTITLPTAVGNPGAQFHIKKIGNTATVTIDGDGTEEIDGSTTAILSIQYDAVHIHSDGAGWFIF